MNRVAAAWDELEKTLKDLDPEMLETLRWVFITGAVVYRRLIFDATTPGDDTDAINDMNTLDEELLELAGNLMSDDEAVH